MPNRFNLTRKSNMKAGPVVLQQIDQELANHLGVPCHPDIWTYGWYDTIGFELACGLTFENIKTQLEKTRDEDAAVNDIDGVEWHEKKLKALAFLSENFTTNAWVEIGRR